MAGIWNVNGIYDVNSKNIINQLSLDIGEMFLARIQDTDAKNSEILIRLIDGRQLTAKLDRPLQDVPKSMVMFQVAGLENETLKLIIVPQKDDSHGSKDSVSDTIERLGLSDDPELHDLLQKMVKHNIPLTKENIAKIKTLIDFKEKMNKSPGEADAFIEKYIKSKGLEPDSKEAFGIKTNLKSFFGSIKNMDTDSILTFMDNGIELTEDNIESFQKLFNKTSVIYKDVKDMAAKLKSALEEYDNQSNAAGTENEAESVLKQAKAENSAGYVKLKESNDVKSFEELYNGLKKISPEDTEAQNLKVNNKNINSKSESKVPTVILQEKGQEEKLAPVKQGSTSKADMPESDDKTDEALNSLKSDKLNTKLQSLQKEVKENGNDTWKQVKGQIAAKTEELKSMIKDISDTQEKIKPEMFSKIFETVKENINDFKIFNSLSNQFYFMDLPVKVNDNEYDCRLLVKDERKKDKKIDSKNVKIAASVKTINMGTVNAFIRISGTNMNVDIKCNEQFITVIDGEKTKLYDELSNLGYNTFINVEKKAENIDISGCSNFFDDNGRAALDTRV